MTAELGCEDNEEKIDHDRIETDSDFLNTDSNGRTFFRSLLPYVRDPIVAQFREQFGCEVTTCSIPSFYTYNTAHCRPIDVIRSTFGKKVQFIDISSGYCVESLGIHPSQRVLELCCAPGNKMVIVAEKLNYNGTIVRVDISPHRLRVCIKILHKHLVIPFVDHFHSTGEEIFRNLNIHIYLADAKEFPAKSTLVFDLQLAVTTEISLSLRNQKKLNKSLRHRQKHALSLLCNTINLSVSSFDRVLVDVECSIDSSHHRHRTHASTLGPWDNSLDQLQQLQVSILSVGLSFLALDGLLLYCTCSDDVRQNEDVIEMVLDQADVVVVDLNVGDDVQVRSGVRNYCRFVGHDGIGLNMCLLWKRV